MLTPLSVIRRMVWIMAFIFNTKTKTISRIKGFWTALTEMSSSLCLFFACVSLKHIYRGWNFETSRRDLSKNFKFFGIFVNILPIWFRKCLKIGTFLTFGTLLLHLAIPSVFQKFWTRGLVQPWTRGLVVNFLNKKIY